MGLDMYLTKTIVFAGRQQSAVVNATDWNDEERTYEFNGERVGVTITYYWRKANHIHAFFIDRCCDGNDDCSQCDVDISVIEDLIQRCEAVTEDHSLASALLTTREGFFFGSTEYDEGYFEDCAETATGLKEFIKPTEGAFQDFSYRASW